MTVTELYDAEREAYYAYVKVSRGEDLVGNQRVSPQRVEDARKEWEEALGRLRAAGGTPEVVRDMLQERVASANTTVRRAR